MNQLNPTSSFETLVDQYGWYAVTRLDGNPDLAAVAADARSNNSDLEQAQVGFRSAARAAMSSASARDEQKYQLDAALRSVRTAVLNWVRNRRSSQYYRTIFPGGLRGVLRTNSEEGLQAARDVLTRMAGCQVPALEPAMEELGAAIDALQVAVWDHSSALRARNEAWSIVQATKVTFCQRYYGLYCQTVQIVGDPALARSYFRYERRVPEPAQDPGELSVTDTEVEVARVA